MRRISPIIDEHHPHDLRRLRAILPPWGRSAPGAPVRRIRLQQGIQQVWFLYVLL